MLLKMDHLRRIVAGEVTCVFRQWRRPTVKPGGTLKTALGVLAIDAVDPVELTEVKPCDVQAAGFDSLTELEKELAAQRPGQLYRIRVRFAGADPRIALRENPRLTPEEVAGILAKLKRMDARSADGNWTGRVLSAIRKHPATRAAELAAPLELEPLTLKTRVRRLKNLGLTESLGTGYRLSPRGEVVLRAIENANDG